VRIVCDSNGELSFPWNLLPTHGKAASVSFNFTEAVRVDLRFREVYDCQGIENATSGLTNLLPTLSSHGGCKKIGPKVAKFLDR
jgi:hypothetical protein